MTPKARNGIVLLRKGGKAATAEAARIRLNADSPEQCASLELLKAEPNLHDLIIGNLTARTWFDVWKWSRAPKIEDNQKAIRWWTSVFLAHSELVDRHVGIRDETNQAILSGKWNAVTDLVTKHQREFGPCLWSMRALLLSSQEQGAGHLEPDFFGAVDAEKRLDVVRACAAIFNLAAKKGITEDQFRKIVTDSIRTDSTQLKAFLDFLLLENCPEPKYLHEVLSLAESMVLIDRYESFLKLAVGSLGQGDENALRFGRASVRLSEKITDRSLRYLADCTSSTALSGLDALSEGALSAWHAYAIGAYAETEKICLGLLSQRLDCMPVIELVVKSRMYLGKAGSTEAPKSPFESLMQHLHNVFSKNEQSEDSLAFLQRFGTRLNILTLALPLRALHSQHSSPHPDKNLHRQASYAFSIHGPRNFEYGHSHERNSAYLNQLLKAYRASSEIMFFCAVLDADYDHERFPDVPAARRHFFRGMSCFRRGAFDESLTELTNFCIVHDTGPLSPFALEEARRALVDLNLVRGNLVEAQALLIKAYIDRPQSVRRLPTKTVFSAARACVDAQRAIEFPILAHLSLDDPHDISLALRRFLRVYGEEIPSALISKVSDKLLLGTLFLRVCTSEVLDSLHSLDTVSKVEAERLSLLKWVVANVPHYVRPAETEILRVTQHAELRDAIRKLEGARVVLNLTGLREAEQDRFSDVFLKFNAQVQLAHAAVDKLIERIRTQGEFLSIEPLQTLKDQRRSAMISFFAAFRDIRDAFILSPHFGIEACLSSKIRHGIVIQHIRKVFVERKVAVGGDQIEKKSVIDFWGDRIQGGLTIEIVAVLEKMTQGINSIAEEVKNVWIQSRTEHRNPVGLFDFSFSDAELAAVYNRFSDMSNRDKFIDNAFDILLDRTRSSLRTVRARISTDLRDRLRRTVDEAISDLNKLTFPERILPLRSVLASCRIDTERICEEMSRWFQDTDVALMGDVSLPLVAKTAVGMVERLNPDFKSKHHVESRDTVHIKGRYFTALVHILFFLVENAIRHSGVNKSDFCTKVNAGLEDRKLIFSVVTRMPSEINAKTASEKIRLKIEESRGGLDPAKVIREGGTGFAKILAAGRYEFKQSNVSISASSDRDWLNVSLELPSDEIVA